MHIKDSDFIRKCMRKNKCDSDIYIQYLAKNKNPPNVGIEK